MPGVVGGFLLAFLFAKQFPLRRYLLILVLTPMMLSYVAAGRLIGYAEPHMNAWDCLAGQLLIAEAGGRVEEQSADAMLAHGGRVVAGSPDVFDTYVAMANEAFGA